MEKAQHCRGIPDSAGREFKNVNREVSHFGIAVPGGVKHVGFRANPLDETGNWPALTDRFNAFKHR